MRVWFRWSAGLFLSLLISGCMQPIVQDEAAAYRGRSQESIQKEAQKQLSQSRFRDASRSLYALSTLYPFRSGADRDMLDLMYAQYQADEKAQAAATADRFLNLYPVHPHADYALYLHGLVYFHTDHGPMARYLPVNLAARDNSASIQAFQDFDKLLQRYPDSMYAQDARKRMLYLRDLFAAHDVLVAEFYLKRGAYLAAIDRAEEVARHYHRSSSVPQALHILEQAYLKTGQQDRAREVAAMRARLPVLGQAPKQKFSAKLARWVQDKL